MELDKILHKRRSVRHFLKKPVSRGLLVNLIEAALEAPTSCNLQLTKYLVIDDPEILAKLSKAASYKFAAAPACILVLYDSRFTVERSSVVSSAAMGTQNILLKAVDLGLAACPMAGFSKDSVIKKILDIPKEMEILLLVPVGFASPQTKTLPPFRVSASDNYSFNRASFGRGLNDSVKLSDHAVSDIINYRSRISTVYLDRFGLNSFPESYYREAHIFFRRFMASRDIRSIIDVMSYDGLFLKCLYSDEISQKLDITSSDYLETNLGFFKETFGCKTSLISDRNEFAVAAEYDAAAFAYQADFTPKLELLVSSLNKIIKPGGFVSVSLERDFLHKRLLKGVLKLWKILKGKRVNIYENNSFYKIGPRRHLTPGSLAKIFNSRGFSRLEHVSQKTGRSACLEFFIFQKLYDSPDEPA